MAVATKISAEEAARNKEILNSANSEKSKKDVMMMNVAELEKHILYLKKNVSDLHMEYESKRKLVDSLAGSLSGAQTQLAMLNDTFEKKNAELVKDLAKHRQEVENADKTLRALIAENTETKKQNDAERAKLYEYRQLCDSQVNAMKLSLSQNQAEWSKREADILEREEKLKLDKEAHEMEKASLAPEFSKITSIKNENILLLQKIAMDKNDIANLKLAIESERQRFQEDKASSAKKIEARELAFKNEEARILQWEQNVKDMELEVRAKSAEADKVLRREQLKKQLDANKK